MEIKFVLVKYFGKVFNKELNTYSVRTDFLKNGLFRFTQPNDFNDRGSEFRLYPYFNEISPSDREYAIKEYKKNNSQINPKIPNDEDLAIRFLGIPPTNSRYDPAFRGRTGLISLAQYDNNSWIQNIIQFNKDIVNVISENFGVLSLSTDALNEHMWVMYASEGKGIAIEFDEEHSFFQQHQPMEVSYLKNDRATYTYYNGIELINGIKRKKFTIEELTINEMKDLFKKLALSKKNSWHQEKEKRVIMGLNEASNHEASHELHYNYPKISLKKIPFDAFKSIIYGYAADKELIDEVNKLLDNPLLSHVDVRYIKHNHLGDLVFDTLQKKTR